MFMLVALLLLTLSTAASAASECPDRELCTGYADGQIATGVTKEAFLQTMSDDFCGCRVIERSININKPESIFNSSDFEFLSSVEEIGDTLSIENLNLTDHITLPNLRLIRGRNLRRYFLDPLGDPALFIFNVTGGVYLPTLREITMGDVYIDSVEFCSYRGVLWEDILTEETSRYEDLRNAGNCPSSSDVIASDCQECDSGYCWSAGTQMCQTLTKNFGTCFVDCGNRRCFLNDIGNPLCCSVQCAAGCSGSFNDQCFACQNFDNNGTCVANCPRREIFDTETDSFVANDDFKFHSGTLCVDSCPSNRFEQGTFCVSQCQSRFQPISGICEPCDGGICTGSTTCRGLEQPTHLLPVEVERFAGCVIVNGNLVFNTLTYREFTDPARNSPFNLSEAKAFMADIEVILGTLTIAGWGEEVFDFLPNLMYIGGFDGNTSLTTEPDVVVISDNNVANGGGNIIVSLVQIQFSQLVEVSGAVVFLINNPTLCYVGDFGYYLTSDFVVTGVDHQRPYEECVADGMACHEQCNVTYRCWGPDDTDCVVCNAFLYTNGPQRICVDTCDSQRLQSLNLFFYPNVTSMTCVVCDEECNNTCDGPGPTSCTGGCRNFAYPIDDDTTICVVQCPIQTYPDESQVCRPCNSLCVPGVGCTGPSDRIEEGGCNDCFYVLRNTTLHQENCLSDGRCPDVTYLNAPRERVELYPFPIRFCDRCHELCLSCNGPDATDCSQCTIVSRTGQDGRTECASSCGDGEYIDGMRCQQCNTECDGCDGGTERDCIECQNFKNFLGDGNRFECVAVGSCPANKYENTTSFVCDTCDPVCAECVGPSPTNCTLCRNPPGYTLTDDPDLLGCCDVNFMAVQVNQTCIPVDPAALGQSSGSVAGPIIGGVIGGLFLIIVIMFIVIITARVLYKTYFVSSKYNEEAGQLENPLYDVSPFSNMQAEAMMLPPKVAPNQARLIIVPETALELGKELGSGAFGTVYKGFWQPEGDAHKYTVAIKVMNENTSAQSQTELLQEGVTMASIDNEYVVRLFCVCLGAKMMLVSEFVPFGALNEHLKKFKSDFNAKTLLTYAAQMASGMKYLESIRMVHRDLAARNVLVQGPQHLKITDFGLTKILDVGETAFKSGGGKVPVRWLAPESLRHRLYTYKSDVWAYGVTVWEVLTFGARPYPGKQARELLGALQSGVRLTQPETCTIDLYAVLLRCWLLDPEARPTFEELETIMNEFLTDPLRYIFTVIDDKLETYSNLPANTLKTGESPYENPFSLTTDESVSGYELPSPLNTLTSGSAPEYDNFKEDELAEALTASQAGGRKNIYDPNFLKSGEYEQPVQTLERSMPKTDEYEQPVPTLERSKEYPMKTGAPLELDDGYGLLRDVQSDAYGNLGDVAVVGNPNTSDYLQPGATVGSEYQPPGQAEDDNHDYHDIDENKKGDDDGYEQAPDFDHEYHEVPDELNFPEKNKSPRPDFDSPEYMPEPFTEGNDLIPLNSSNNNNNNNATEYEAVTGDMMLPPHMRDTLPKLGSQSAYENLKSSETEL